MPFPEIKVALDELHTLERKLKDPSGPVERVLERYAVRMAIVSLETVQQLSEQRDISVTTR